MKMQKVIKSSASYPIKPILFTAITIVALSGCQAKKLPPQKGIKPLPPIHINNSEEPLQPAIAGAPLASPIKK